MAAKKVGNQTLFSISTLSDELALDRKTVVRRLQGLEPDKIGGGKSRAWPMYYMSSVLKHLLEADNRYLDTTEAKANLDRQREKQIRMKNEQTEGLVVKREDVYREVKGMIQTAKSRLLTLPTSVAGRVMALDNQEEVAGVIRAELYVILSGLSASSWEETKGD